MTAHGLETKRPIGIKVANGRGADEAPAPCSHKEINEATMPQGVAIWTSIGLNRALDADPNNEQHGPTPTTWRTGVRGGLGTPGGTWLARGRREWEEKLS